MTTEPEAPELPEEELDPSAQAAAGDGEWPDFLPDVGSVLDYLEAEGWKCGKTKLYDDMQAGKLRRQADGSIRRKDVDRYAKVFDLPRRDGHRIKAWEERTARKLKEAELRKAEAQADREVMKARKEAGELIEAERVWQELAGRLAVLRADFENATHEAGLWVVERFGLPSGAAAEVQERLAELGEDWFSRYGDAREFRAVLTPQGGEED